MRCLAAGFLALSVLAPVVAQENDGQSPGSKPKSVVIERSARQDTVWRGELISLSLKDADLAEVLRSFARLVGANLVIDPAVQGKVTLELSDVPWDQALSVILKSQRLGMEVSGNKLWTLAPENGPSARSPAHPHLRTTRPSKVGRTPSPPPSPPAGALTALHP